MVALELYLIAVGILILCHLLALQVVNFQCYTAVGLGQGDLRGLGEGVGGDGV